MAKCSQVIYPKGEGHVRVAKGKVWPRRRKCMREASDGFFCWQHRPPHIWIGPNESHSLEPKRRRRVDSTTKGGKHG